MKFVMAVAVCSIALAASASAVSHGSSKAAEPSRYAIIELGKKSVQKRLKDPWSANFQNLTIHRGTHPVDETYYVCGEVNSKNAFGGYAGFTPFQALVFYWADKHKGITGTATVWDATYDQSKWAEMQNTNCVN